MLLIFLQHLIHQKNGSSGGNSMFSEHLIFVFQLKQYKKEVLEIILLLLFVSSFNLDAITNENNKDYNTKWSHRMLIIGPSRLGKTNALLNLTQ